MRTWKMRVWVCGAVLCCFMPTALCQTLSGSLAAGTGVSEDTSQGGNGMGSISARSDVSANANSAVNAESGTSVDAEAAGGAVVYGSGAGGVPAGHRANLNFRIVASPDSITTAGRLDFRLKRGLPGRRSPESGSKAVSGGPAMRPARSNARYRIPQVEQRGSGRASRAAEDSARNLRATGVQAGASYSTDFPDSTKGTALLSPPDSTASPLDWTPTLNYGFPDFAEQQFFEPSLHTGGNSQIRRREAASNKAVGMGANPGVGITSPGLSTAVSGPLQTHIPDLLAVPGPQ